MKKTVLLFLVIGLFASCKRDSVSIEQNADFEIELLFEKDGCKMYRFWDGRWVYWSTCDSKTSWVESNGKTSMTHEVNTNTK